MSVNARSEKDRAKVVAAITASVTSCMEEPQLAHPLVILKRKPSPAVKPWSVSGREQIMRMRTMCQRRMV